MTLLQLDDLSNLGVVGIRHQELNDRVSVKVDSGVESTNVVAEDQLFEGTGLDVSNLDQACLKCNDVGIRQCKRFGTTFPFDQLLLGQLTLLGHQERKIYRPKT